MIEASSATEYLTAVLKGFKMEAAEAESIVDKLTKVDIAAAVSAGGIAEALSRTSVSAQLAGLDLSQTIGIVSTIGEVTQKSMESVGESVKTLLSRYGNVKAGVFTGMDLEEGGEATENINDIEKVLGKLGISIRTTSLEMRNVWDVLDEVAEKWQTLDTVSKNAISTAMAGVRQRENLNVLFENWSKVEELTGEARESEGTAADKYESYTESIEAALNRLSNAFEKFVMTLEANGLISGFLDVTTWLIDKLDAILPAISSFFTNIGITSLIRKRNSPNSLMGSFRSFLWGDGQFGRGALKLLGFERKIPEEEEKWRKRGWSVSRSEDNKLTESDKATNENTQAIRDNTAAIEKATQVDAATTEKASGAARGIVASQVAYKTKSSTGQQLAMGMALSGSAIAQGLGDDVSGYVVDEQGRVIAKTKNEKGEDVYSLYSKEKGGNRRKLNSAAVGKYLEGATRKNGGNAVDLKSMYEAQAAAAQKRAEEEAAKQAAAKQESVQQEAIKAAKPSFLKGLGSHMKGNLVNMAALSSVVASGMTAGFTTSEVQGSGDLSEYSVEATTGDKIIQGATTAGLTALGTALLGPVGGAIGGMLGDVLGGVLLEALHKDELEMQKRVDEANKKLESLNKIETALTSYEQVASKDVLYAEDYEQLNTVVDQFEESLIEMTGGVQSFVAAVQESVKGFEDADFNEILDAMINGNKETREALNRQMQLQAVREELSATTAANEETYAKYNELSNARLLSETSWGKEYGLASGHADPRDLLRVLEHGEDLWAETEADSDWFRLDSYFGHHIIDADNIHTLVEEVRAKVEQYEAVERERAQLAAQVGYLASGISGLTNDEQDELSYNSVRDRVIAAIEAEGYQVRDSAGRIQDVYSTAIDSLIKSDENLSRLVRGETQTVSSVTEDQEKLSKLIDRLNEQGLVDSQGHSYDYDSLRFLLDYANPANTAKLQELAEAIGMTSEEFSNLIYKADPTTIESIASALNITVDRLEGLKDVLGDISFALAAGSPAEVREHFEGYLDIFTDLAENGALSQENLEKIIENYPELLEKASDNQELLAFLSESLFGTSGQQDILYENALFNSLMSNKDFFGDFKERVKELGITIPETLQEAWKNATTFEQAKQVLLNSNAPEELREAWEQYFKDNPLEYELDKTAIEQVIDYQTRELDKQISNLEEQKDTLSEINEERRKELDLMKAQDALENAKEEKIRVYREGVGWTYESDAEAIESAQKELEDLEIERQQNEIQAEIDRLTAQKEMLEELPDQEELKGLESVWKDWSANILENNSTQAMILAKIVDSYNALGKLDFYEKYFGEGGGYEADRVAQGKAKASLVEAMSALGNAREAYSSASSKAEGALTGDSVATKDDAYVKWLAAYETFESALKEAEDLGVDLSGLSTSIDEEVKKKPVETALNPNSILGYGTGTIRDEGTTQKGVFFNPEAGTSIKAAKLSDNFWLAPYDETLNGWEDWQSVENYNNKNGTSITANTATTLPDGTLVRGKNNYFMVYNGQLLAAGISSSENLTGNDDINFERFARGTTSTGERSRSAIINEEGAEAIVTPSGTVTTLPAHSGVVPADITKNLWKLGEVAPTLVAALGSLNAAAPSGSQTGNITNNDGTFIDNLSMTIYPTKDYDMDKFIAEVKAKARLTRHT